MSAFIAKRKPRVRGPLTWASRPRPARRGDRALARGGGCCWTSVRALAARPRSRRAPPPTTAPATSRGTMSRRSTRSASTPCSCPRPMAARRSPTPPISPAVREISAACASTGIIWATTFHAMKPLVDFGSEEQKRRLLPRIAAGGARRARDHRAEAGSDATAMTHALRAEGRRRSSSTAARSSSPTAMSPISISCSANGRASTTSARRSRRSSSRRARRASASCATRTSSATAPRRPRRSLRRTAACRAPICWPRRAQGLSCCSPRSTNRGRASPRTRSGIARAAFDDAVALRQRAAPVRPPHHRLPGHPVHARRPRRRSRAGRGVAVACRGGSSMAARRISRSRRRC